MRLTARFAGFAPKPPSWLLRGDGHRPRTTPGRPRAHPEPGDEVPRRRL